MVFSTFPRAGSRVQDRAQKKAEVLMWGGMGNLQLQVVIIEMVHLHEYPNHGIYSVSNYVLLDYTQSPGFFKSSQLCLCMVSISHTVSGRATIGRGFHVITKTGLSRKSW